MENVNLKIIIAVILLNLKSFAAVTYKTVTMDWTGTSILWEGQTDLVPAKEPFYIAVSKLSTGGTLNVEIFESTGKSFSKLGKGSSLGTLKATEEKNVYTVLIDKQLRFRRYYILEFTFTPSGAGAADPVRTQTVYTSALNDELSNIQFYSGLGVVGFAQTGRNHPEWKLGFATGAKVKFRPNSTNKVVGRYGLYPFRSRCSLILGAVVNDLKYKSSDIKAAFIGIKPLVAFDFEFSKNVGITVGSMFGNQEIENKLNSKPSTVAGFWVSLSFSADLFSALKNGVPSDKFPK